MPLFNPPRYNQGDLNYGDDPRDYGFLTQTLDPAVSPSGVVLTTGTQYFMKAWWPRTALVTNVWFGVSTIGVTLTAGANNLAVYNSAGTQLCATADQTTNYTTTGIKTVAFTSATTIPGGPGTFIWIGMKSSGTTPVSVYRVPGVAIVGNVNLSAANAKAASNGTNAATLMPASITPTSNAQAANTFWLALT